MVALCRVLSGKPLLRIERSTIDYLAELPRRTAIQLFPAELVETLSHPFENKGNATEFSEPAYVFELNDIDFWGRYGGSVVTSGNRLLADLSPEVWGIENHAIFSTFRLPKPRALHGRVAICVTPEAPGNYYHWLADLLPRVALLKQVPGGFGDFAQILINGSAALYEEASLTELGVPLNKVLYVDSHSRFRIANATIPSMDHSSKIVAPWKIRALREIQGGVADRNRSTPKRIYISRRRAAVRRVLNEEELSSLLEENGFTLVELESVPWTEQVRFFSNSDVVVAPHGAALANMVFCRPNSLIVEIGTRVGFQEFYWRLASSASLRYRFIEARPRVTPQPDSRRAVENEDMIVDEHTLNDFLRDL